MKRPRHHSLVRSGRATGRRIPLCALDATMGAISTGRAFFFRERLDGTAMRASLARVLMSYPLLSGRAERDANGVLHVLCDDSGVHFEEENSALGAEIARRPRAGRRCAPSCRGPRSSGSWGRASPCSR